MAHRALIARLAPVALAVLAAAAAGAQPPVPTQAPGANHPAYQPLQAYPTETAARTHAIHVAVVGAVRSPSTFKLPHPVSYAALIEAAGGPDSDSSGTVHVVRGGHILFAFYSANGVVGDPIGPLHDGDIVVLRPSLGINRAHLVTTADDGKTGTRSPVHYAGRPQFVHVACLGLADRPVVLPLASEDAKLGTLLDMLRIPGVSDAERGVFVLPAAGAAPEEGALTDGMVLMFNPQALDLRRAAPVEEFPAARELPADANTGGVRGPQANRQADAPSFDTMILPGVPRIVYGDAVEAVPASERTVIRSAPSSALSTRQTENGTVDQRSTLASPFFESSPDFAVPSPLDVTPAPAGPVQPEDAGSPNGSHAFQLSATSLEGISPAVIHSSGEEIVEPKARARTSSPIAKSRSATAPSPGRSLLGTSSPFVAIIFTAVMALICAITSALWARQMRRRQRGAARADAVSRRRVDTPLAIDQLLANKVPVVVASAPATAPIRLHGKTVGRARLMFDQAHPVAAGPHFLKSGPTEREAARSRRSEQHLAAAITGPSSRRRARAKVAALPPGVTASGFDVVQPEEAPPRRVAPLVSPPSATPVATTRPEQDLLTRVLQSLSEGRS